MDNPKADSTKKIDLYLPKLDWAAPRDSALMALFNGTNAGGGASKSSPNIITSGSMGFDGTTDPGAPGEPV